MQSSSNQPIILRLSLFVIWVGLATVSWSDPDSMIGASTSSILKYDSINYPVRKPVDSQEVVIERGRVTSSKGTPYSGVIQFQDNRNNINVPSEWYDGKQRGFNKVLNPDGKPVELFYSEMTDRGPKSEGLKFHYEYHENGNLFRSGTTLDGHQHGTWRTYHENGTLKTIESWYHGDPVGATEAYREDGAIMMRGFIMNGQQDGVLENYYPNGALKSVVNIRGSIESPERLGPGFYFDPNGAISTSAKEKSLP